MSLLGTALLCLQLAHVELELLALKNVAVASARLAGTRRDASVHLTGSHLVSKGGVNHASLSSGGVLSLDRVGFLLLSGLLLLLGSGGRSLLGGHLDTVVLLVPGAERGRVDQDDGTLHQRLGAHQLVVRGVVHDVNATGLAGDHYKSKQRQETKK